MPKKKAKKKATDGPVPLPEPLDLKLGWRRALRDRPQQVFFNHPHMRKWIERDLDGWIANLETSIDRGFSPHDMHICQVPKPGWMTRPGAVLHIEDEVVLNAIFAANHQVLWDALAPAHEDPDTGCQLLPPPAKADWVKPRLKCWHYHKDKSLSALEQSTHVLFTDIAGFYDNINLGKLRSLLASVGMDSDCLDILFGCLKRWSSPRDRGIPQGYSWCDVLAKLYLKSVDDELRNEGFRHIRYVDDFSVFCDSETKARTALMFLEGALRCRGLDIQSAKTEIRDVQWARIKILGAAPVIEGVLTELRGLCEEFGDYLSPEDIAEVCASSADSPEPGVLDHIFDEEIAKKYRESNGKSFDKTLFHFVLNLLAKAESRKAVPFCRRLLPREPQETRYILRYFGQVSAKPSTIRKMLKYAGSSEAIYDYQLYLIARWLHESESYPKSLVRLCRRWAFDKNRDACLRCYALAVLGAAGTRTDLERIERSYSRTSDEEEKAGIVMALARMERRRRNAFYGRVKKDGDLIRRAVELVKSTPS